MRSSIIIRFSIARNSRLLLESAIRSGESIHTAAKRIVENTLFLDFQNKEINDLKDRVAALESAIEQLKSKP
jgi:hypothetical protein